MRLFLLILLIAPTLSFAVGNDGRMFVSGGTAPSSPGTTICVGWTNTDCAGMSSAASIYNFTSNKSLHRPSWTAPHDGTIKAIWIEEYNYAARPDHLRHSVFKYNSTSTEWEPLCYDEFTDWLSYDNVAWNRYPISTGACTFETGDVLSYGPDVDVGAGTYTIQMTTTGGGGRYSHYAYDDPIANIPSFTELLGPDLPYMLEYETD